MVVKRYSNRRLYDTDESRYVTLDELAARIRAGEDLTFVDAPSGEDITQHFLAQIIFDGRGASRLLPVPLLYQLVRMPDDALTDFFGRYVTWALEVYTRMRSGARAVASYSPFGQLPYAEMLARLFGQQPQWGGPPPPASEPAWPAPPEPTPPPPPTPEDVAGDAANAADGARSSASRDEIAALREELEAIKAVIKKGSK